MPRAAGDGVRFVGTLADVAGQGAGVALLPVRMFTRVLQQGRLVRPFDVEIVTGGYWLTSLKSKPQTAAMRAFRTWLLDGLGVPESGE